METVTVAIGIGLIVSLLMSEAFGLSAGGMVVPGYIALFLNKPAVVALTLAAALATYLVVKLLASRIILYGKRRTALMILVGFVLGAAVRSAAGLVSASPYWAPGFEAKDFAVIGFIIPGLMAIWFDRQGVLATCGSVLTAGVLVRLILIACGVGLLA